jgi:phosphatidylglycerophosphate synthase
MVRRVAMWLAHLLTLSRIPIAIGLWVTYGDPAWSVALVALAAATDAADGNVARWMQRHGHTQPAIGGWLDPLVDKLFVAIVLVLIWVEAGERLVVALVAVREVALIPVVAVHLVKRLPVGGLHAEPIGKAATIAQLLALAAVFGAPRWAVPAAAAAAVLGLAAAWHYAVRELRELRAAA